MGCNCKKIYAERDVIDLGRHYTRHVCHMTYEGLHNKSDIAAELAYRDERIEALEKETRILARALSALRTNRITQSEARTEALKARPDQGPVLLVLVEDLETAAVNICKAAGAYLEAVKGE